VSFSAEERTEAGEEAGERWKTAPLAIMRRPAAGLLVLVAALTIISAGGGVENPVCCRCDSNVV